MKLAFPLASGMQETARALRESLSSKERSSNKARFLTDMGARIPPSALNKTFKNTT